MLVSYDYYAEMFLSERGPLISETDFVRWERQAEIVIDAVTNGRLSHLTSAPDKVKLCICAVMELEYQAEMQAAEYREQGLAGPLASWSNDGQSGSVDLGKSVLTEEGKQKQIRSICRMYLAGTGLLYAGVDHYES